jgi:5'-3' exonuclease
MLGLSTHEAHFYILREAFANPKDLICYKCKQKGHRVTECGNGYTEDKTRLARAVEF